MSWTTVCDLAFTRYGPGLAFDSTRFQNNAQIAGGALPHPGHVTFQHPDDQLVVPVRDDSLARFTALRVEALVRPAVAGRRLNIVEGWMSFAFFVEADGALWGTVYDGHNWVPVTSGTSHVPLNAWSGVSFEYDGICIGQLTLNGARVGSSVTMPMGMRQPNQNITIGHWPSGDGRYTFTGDLGHVRISRRDYDDFWRDAVLTMLCRRRFTPRQADAMQELIVMMNRLDPKVKAELRRCARARSQALLEFFRTLRAGHMRTIATHRDLAERLREAWCCHRGPMRAEQILLDFFRRQAGPADSRQRTAFTKALNEFLAIGARCERTGPPFDRMRELLLIVVPELAGLPAGLLQLAEVV